MIADNPFNASIRNAAGELGFKVFVGGGMGRTPVISTLIRDFLPWHQIMNYLEAVVRVYNRWGRRDNLYKARIKILVKAEGQRYIDEVEAEYQQIITRDGGPHTISQSELDRVTACFVPPALTVRAPATASTVTVPAERQKDYDRWLQQNVAAHKNPALRAVTTGARADPAHPRWRRWPRRSQPGGQARGGPRP